MNQDRKILNLIGPGFAEKGKEALSQIGQVDYLDLTEEQLLQCIGQYDILVVGLSVKVSQAVIERGVRLKVIATATTGTDHIDLKAAAAKGIAVLGLKDEREFLSAVTSTAELAFLFVLMLSRNILDLVDLVGKNQWKKIVGHSLSGRVLGIVGFGRLGRLMAGYGRAFGMEVIAFDPHLPATEFDQAGCRRADFDTLVSVSDYISLHVHLSQETENMFNGRVFDKMKQEACLINTSRGKIVNESDLLSSLEAGKLGGYAADVLGGELDFSTDVARHPLIELSKRDHRVIITPHIGGTTYESREKTDIFIAQKIIGFIK
jgi:D-3-phosphoglycerate dehydrogenase / 2-oxoglutarate reductase